MENTLEAALKQWKEREQRYEKLFSPSVLKSREFLREKLRHYDSLRAKVMAASINEDPLAMRALQLERRQLARQAYPSLISRLVEKVISAFKLERDVAKIRLQTQSNSEDIRSVMGKAGLEKYYGHAEQQMKKGAAEFNVPVSYHVSEKERMDLQLNFKRGDDGNYRIEDYKADLRSEDSKGKAMQQTFPVGESGIDTGKAYNLLAGRAIQHNGTWQQLDFNDKDANGNYRMKHFPQNYGFDITKILEQLPLKDRQGADRLGEQLAAGQKIEVTLRAGNRDVQCHLEANPQKREIALYDHTGSKVTVDSLKDAGKPEIKTARVRSLVPKQESTPVKVKKNAIRH
jgi:hypothetical protein